ncbi:gliding motility-associated C-terminal domain-containing protein [Pedobacter sp. NJ-S-72]
MVVINSAMINNLIISEKSIVLIPNSFSPNGDNINDEFKVYISNLRNFSISIFNRYGAKIFTSNTISNSWNGTYNGAIVPPGAYFYYINGFDILNKEFKYKGSITLIK